MTPDAPATPRAGDPDPTPGAAGATAADRRCAYRACRASLPPPTGRPGNRPKYCQDGKTWGPAELTCKAAEAAYVAVESLQGDAPVAAHGLQELGDRLDAIADPLAQLLSAVTGTRTQLDEDVLSAYSDRDAARAEAAADRGAREVAEQDADRAREAAAQARDAAAEAETLRAAAIRARDAAAAAAQAAERDRLRAEGQLAALEERLRRAEDLTAESAANAGRLQVELAECTATLRATDAALGAERERGRELEHAHHQELHERHARVAAARDEAAQQLTQQRTEHERTVAELREQHERRLATARAEHERTATQLRTEHTAALDAAHAERENALMRITSAHTDALGAMRQRLGAAEYKLDRLRTEAATEE